MDLAGIDSRLDEEKAVRPDADMVAPDAAEEKEKTPSAAGWRLMAALFAVLAVGGLFLGLLGKVASFLAPVEFFNAGVLEGSLVGYAVGYLKSLAAIGFSAAFHGGASAVLSTLANLALILLLFVAVVASVIAFILSLAAKKRARKAAFVSGVLVFLSYCGFFFWSYYKMSRAASLLGAIAPTREICDLPTAIVALAALLLLSIGAIASNKRCFANVLLLLVPLLAAFLVLYPGSLTVLVTAELFSFGSGAFVKAAEIVLIVAIVFNIFFSVLRITSGKRYAFDCFRFVLLLAGVLLTVVAFIAQPATGSRWALFLDQQLYYTIGLAALSVAAFILTVILAVTSRGAGAKAAEEEAPADAPAPLFLSGEGDARDGRSAESKEEAPLLAEGDASGALPLLAEAAKEDPAKKEEPISEFERRMEALARGEQPDAAPPAPVLYPAPARAGNAAPARPAGYASADQYTYDPFINSLTPQEKNEFGDLFIACKAGKFEGLPIYAIGGNNDEFFRKVFIYLGKFRKDISAPLLDKLYSYVSKLG